MQLRMMKRPSKPTPKTNTLLIDGENLLKIGFYVNKSVNNEHGRVKAIYHFINTIRKFYTNFAVTKVIVFWEGEHSRDLRRQFYPEYKANRGGVDDDIQLDLNRQRVRIKQYLEELYIRQVIIDECEADDNIALYCHMAPHEQKIILSADRDLLQLLSDHTSCYLTDKQVLVTPNNFKDHFDYHYKNIGIVKMIGGDSADNICGISGVGAKTVIKLFPEIKTQEITMNWIRSRALEILTEQPNNNPIKRIITGETKYGTWGDEYFNIMNKIINLNEPIVSEEAKEIVNQYIFYAIDPGNRGGVQAVNKLLVEDGIERLLPSNDDGYYGFWAAFITIINKEIRLFKTIS